MVWLLELHERQKEKLIHRCKEMKFWILWRKHACNEGKADHLHSTKHSRMVSESNNMGCKRKIESFTQALWSTVYYFIKMACAYPQEVHTVQRPFIYCICNICQSCSTLHIWKKNHVFSYRVPITQGGKQCTVVTTAYSD